MIPYRKSSAQGQLQPQKKSSISGVAKKKKSKPLTMPRTSAAENKLSQPHKQQVNQAPAVKMQVKKIPS